MALEILVIGAFMGILGQGARAIVGLKGMADDAKAQGLSPQDLFEAGRLLTSFLIGIIVGLASVLVYLKDGGSLTSDPSWQTMLAWAVSAYAGTDFLEGFISQYLSPGVTSVAARLQQQQSTVADYVTFTDTIASTIGCGSVKAGATPPKDVTSAVLACIGVKSPTDPKTQMSSYFSQSDSGDWLVPFVIKLESTKPFVNDVLRLNITYVAQNGTTLGGFVGCIQCCYAHPRAATTD